MIAPVTEHSGVAWSPLDADRSVGGTPLVGLTRAFRGAQVWAKLEGANPGGSAKDRSALAMVEASIRSGRLVPGSLLVESSSGNFGVALAALSARHGFRFCCVVDARANPSTLAAIRALGATLDIVSAPDPATGDWLEARIARVRSILANDPGAVCLDQYSNQHAVAAHRTTMREVLAALDDRVDAILVATSTTGTIGGCLREVQQRGLSTRVIAVDAVGSILFGGTRGERLLPGYGSGRLPELAQSLRPHLVIRIRDQDAVAGCRVVARQEGLLVGASAGAVTAAAARLLPDLGEGARVVLLFHDRGEPYLSTVYSDAWVEQSLGLTVKDLDRRLRAWPAWK